MAEIRSMSVKEMVGLLSPSSNIALSLAALKKQVHQDWITADKEAKQAKKERDSIEDDMSTMWTDADEKAVELTDRADNLAELEDSIEYLLKSVFAESGDSTIANYLGTLYYVGTEEYGDKEF